MRGNRITDLFAPWVSLQNGLARRHLLRGNWPLRMRVEAALRRPISGLFVHRGPL